MEVKSFFFSISVLPKIKNSLRIFICDNEVLCFMMYYVFWSNQHFTLRPLFNGDIFPN